MKWQIARILFELKGAGYSSEEIEKLIRRTEKEAWFGRKELRPTAKMNPEWAKRTGAIDDLLRTVEDEARSGSEGACDSEEEPCAAPADKCTPSRAPMAGDSRRGDPKMRNTRLASQGMWSAC